MSVELPPGNWWDWELWSWNGHELRLAAGHDLTYYHGLELVFSGVTYVSCPTFFNDPVFRDPGPEQLDMVRRVAAGPGASVIVAFDAESASASLLVPCLVVAGRIEVIEGTVYRYPREGLGPGERLAPGVSPPEEAQPG